MLIVRASYQLIELALQVFGLLVMHDPARRPRLSFPSKMRTVFLRRLQIQVSPYVTLRYHLFIPCVGLWAVATPP